MSSTTPTTYSRYGPTAGGGSLSARLRRLIGTAERDWAKPRRPRDAEPDVVVTSRVSATAVVDQPTFAARPVGLVREEIAPGHRLL